MVRVRPSWFTICGATIAVLALGLIALLSTGNNTSPEGLSRPPSAQQSSRPCLTPLDAQPALSGNALVAYLNSKGVAAATAAAPGSQFIEAEIPAGGCANPMTASATTLTYSLTRGITPAQTAYVWNHLMKSGYFDRITETATSTS
jgi:hypothetical protein